MWRIGNLEKAYRTTCNKVVEDDLLWKSVKSNPILRYIWGTDDLLHVAKCINRVKECPEVYANLENFKLNDGIGSEMLFRLPDGKISGTVARSAETIALIHNTFGSLNGKRIVEVGAGPGVLAVCCKKQWPDCAYTIVDLPEACLLSQKYIREMGINDVDFGDTLSISNVPIPDLLIAEYSISEQDDATIQEYWDKLIKRSNAFFMRWNTFDNARNNRWYAKFREEFNLSIEEEHFTRGNNFIVIGER